MFDNLVCQIPRCLNVIVASVGDKMFRHQVPSKPVIIFGIIVNIEIVEAFMTSDRVAYFGYGDPERPKNRYARFWRAAYLRMSDCELRQATFRGEVREPLAEIGAESRA